MQFNVSHAANDWLLVVSRSLEVGIDIEPLRPIPHLEALAVRTLHPDELPPWQALAPAEAAGAWLVNWTRKEALFKAWGVGLTRPMASVSLGWAGKGAVALDASGQQWEIRDLPLGEGRLAAVAREGSHWRLAGYTWNAGPVGSLPVFVLMRTLSISS